MSNELLLGLRFPRSQVRRLREIVTQLRSDQPEGIDIGLFEKALECALTHEPLQVRCSNRLEVVVMADGFTRWGVARPAIEELSGTPTI